MRVNKKFFVLAGRKGGKKTALRGSEYYRKLQKKSVRARKRNLSTATACKRLYV